MRKIIFLWASIRPQMLRSTWIDWLSKCSSDTSNIFLKIAVASDEQKQEVESFGFNNCEVQVVSEKKGYTYAVTKLTQELETEDDSILLLLSDDFFAPDNWDIYLYNKFNGFDGALFLDDGYQNKNVKSGQCCITLSCMTFSCLKKLNKIVIHPEYQHFFSDNEVFINLTELGLLKDDRDIDNAVFQHKHYVTGYREQDEYDRENLSKWNIDKATFDNRMSMTIEERLRING